MGVSMKNTNKFLLAVITIGSFVQSAFGQTVSGSVPYAQTSRLITNTGSNNIVVPPNVTIVYINGCAAGGGGQ